MKKLLLFLLLCVLQTSWSQEDSLVIEVDSLNADTVSIGPLRDNNIQFAQHMASFYKKLALLESEKKGKINVVHIGDSHIQADIMTDRIRKNLQSEFGNAGRGLVFPHRLAGTNGASDYKFNSNVKWKSHRNIHSPNGSPVGLSGISLQTQSKDFVLEFQTKYTENAFRRIKVVTPGMADAFQVATTSESVFVTTTFPKNRSHKIKKGEVLGAIADKYNLSVSALKKANGLKSDRIREGKTLKIPSHSTETRSIAKTKFNPIDLLNKTDFWEYQSNESIQSIYLLPKDSSTGAALSGLVLENDQAGILYHAIGVNGAKLSDYTKYPDFFKEVRALEPDLIVIGLGTNESFDRMSAQDYSIQLRSFIDQTRAQNPEVDILVYSPPPSLFKKRIANTFVFEYAKQLEANASEMHYAFWDLYDQLGGYRGVPKNYSSGIIGGDRVHYTVKGYQLQADWFTQALTDGFQSYKQTR